MKYEILLTNSAQGLFNGIGATSPFGHGQVNDRSPPQADPGAGTRLVFTDQGGVPPPFWPGHQAALREALGRMKLGNGARSDSWGDSALGAIGGGPAQRLAYSHITRMPHHLHLTDDQAAELLRDLDAEDLEMRRTADRLR